MSLGDLQACRKWPHVCFGDVVRSVRAVERDPLENGLEYYVGLEHLDPESLHIRRWGLIADGTSFTRKFVKGQVLFGKRRAYQRKAAVAEFDGVCSGDILVFEPKDDRLLPELLPFIVQSEGFVATALRTSAGSLSPRTRWRDLAAYEFPLPPLDEQRRIAEILWAAENSFVQFQNVFRRIACVKQSLLMKLTQEGHRHTALKESRIGAIPIHWNVAQVGDLLEICQYGLSVRASDSGQYPILRMMNFEDGAVVANDLKYINLSDEDFSAYKLKAGDILFNRTNSADLVGKVGIYQLDGDFVFASYLIRLRTRSEVVLPEYLNYYLNSPRGQQRILFYATAGVSQTNINGRNLQRVLVPVPPLEEQREIVAVLEQASSSRAETLSHLTSLRTLKAGLLSQLFEQSYGTQDQTSFTA